MSSLHWGILATGSISHQFAGGVKASKTGTLVAVGSRTMESATKFTDRFGGKPYDSYQAVLDDPEVQAVYIGLPHDMHAEWTIRAAKAGKGILCEKPFTLTKKEAERALAAVKEAGVFFMEAFMYRCHPQTTAIKKLVDEGEIGELLQIDAEFGFNAGKDWGNFRLTNAGGGGGLMDVGVYPISFARYMFGEEPTRVFYSAQIGEKGYDEAGSGVLEFSKGRTLRYGTGVHINLENGATLYGSEGKIIAQNPWKSQPGLIKVVKYNGVEVERVLNYSTTNDQLYGYEADAVADYFAAGECPHMTIADTLGNMDVLDKSRQSAGLHFEGEELR